MIEFTCERRIKGARKRHICIACGTWIEAAGSLWGDCVHHTEYWQFVQKLDAEAYLDAAAMFVPEGADYSIGSYKVHFGRVDMAHDAWVYGAERTRATTPYFALLSAAMKARQTDERD